MKISTFLFLIFTIFSQPHFGTSQEFSFSGQIGQDAQVQPEEFRRRQAGGFGGGFGNQGVNPTRQGGGTGFPSSSASASAGGGNGTLQDRFTACFDWNRELANDPQFQACTPPDIGDIERACPKRAFFYSFNPQHRRAVGTIKQMLTDARTSDEAICLAGRLRDLSGMNPNVWIRGFLGAHLSDARLFDFQVPPMVEVMPNIFLAREYIDAAKRQTRMAPAQRQCVRVDGSVGRDNGVENILWYFREDVQVNSFHLNWHLIYPFTGITQKADRQGELFYFSHHSHISRYNAERLSNGMPRIPPLYLTQNGRVPEGYNPHLTDTNSAQNWTPRVSERVVRDTMSINISGLPPMIRVSDRIRFIQRVQEAIQNGFLVSRDGRRIPLDSRRGIDLLGDAIEATVFSVNPEWYGSFGFHNEGHVLLGLIEDPTNRTNVPPGVMIEVATAMRDPVFYSYHNAMDETFDLHKQALPPYRPEGGELPLKWNGIEITSVEVNPDNGIKNSLTTFFNTRNFDMTRGLDFNRTNAQGPINACVQHLDHDPFTYTIYVNRAAQAGGRGTVRIFLAPRFDERGRRLSMVEQRRLFFMMDLFTVQLQPGLNRITRRSLESSLTVDVPQSVRPLQSSRTQKMNERPRTFCGCGWPHHLLLPRGNERGMAFDLFVMLTDGNQDYVAPRLPSRTAECKPAPIYCGRLNDTYPDAKPMGYPFDRLPYNAPRQSQERPSYVPTLEQYVTGIPNMAATQVTITHRRGGSGQSPGAPAALQVEPPPSNLESSRPQIQFPGEAPQSGAAAVAISQAGQEYLTGSGNIGGTLHLDDRNLDPNLPQLLGLQNVPLIHQEHVSLGGEQENRFPRQQYLTGTSSASNYEEPVTGLNFQQYSEPQQYTSSNVFFNRGPFVRQLHHHYHYSAV